MEKVPNWVEMSKEIIKFSTKSKKIPLVYPREEPFQVLQNCIQGFWHLNPTGAFAHLQNLFLKCIGHFFEKNVSSQRSMESIEFYSILFVDLESEFAFDPSCKFSSESFQTSENIQFCNLSQGPSHEQGQQLAVSNSKTKMFLENRSTQ